MRGVPLRPPEFHGKFKYGAMSSGMGSARQAGPISGMSKVEAAKAMAIQQEALSKKAHEICLQESAVIVQELQTSLQSKVSSLQAVIGAMQGRLASVNKSIDCLKQANVELSVAVHAKEGPFILCAWRMGQRERRPLREHVRDPVAVALDAERGTLTDHDKRLSEASKRNIRMISALEIHRDQLKRDIQEKSHTLKADAVCLANASSIGHGQLLSLQGPPLPRGSRPSSASAGNNRRPNSSGRYRPSSARSGSGSQWPRQAVGEGRPASGRRESGASAMIDPNGGSCCVMGDLEDMVRAASLLCDGSRRLIQQGDLMIVQCKKKTDSALKEQVLQMGDVKMRLEIEAMETRKKQCNTQALIQETRSQIQQLDEPMKLCSMHSSRQTRVPNVQRGADPVEMRLQEQKWKLVQTTKELRRHRKIEKDILTDLDDHMDRLKEDIEDKTAAMAIDLSLLTQAKLMSGRTSCS